MFSSEQQRYHFPLGKEDRVPKRRSLSVRVQYFDVRTGVEKDFRNLWLIPSDPRDATVVASNQCIRHVRALGENLINHFDVARFDRHRELVLVGHGSAVTSWAEN